MRAKQGRIIGGDARLNMKRTYLSYALIITTLWGGSAAAMPAAVPMVLLTTPKHTDEMRSVDGILAPNRPGHQAELILEAGKRCGAAVEFRFVPWQRALLLVKNGDADGVFSSSYDAERASYGAYPMAGDKPDVTRALKSYSYSLYVPLDSTVAWDNGPAAGPRPTIAVERGSSVIPRLTELGLSYVEVSDNATMLRMVAGKRVAAAAIITSIADRLLGESRDLATAIRKREPAIEEKFGYVMLSKHFQARHNNVAECFWTSIRDIRATAEYTDLVRSYLAEEALTQ